jgi:hypothetical protein
MNLISPLLTAELSVRRDDGFTASLEDKPNVLILSWNSSRAGQL